MEEDSMGAHGGSREDVRHQVHTRQSLPEERQGNPWRHPRFIETTYSLQEKLIPSREVRSLCYSLGLIDTESYDQLQLLISKFEHNDQLLSYLKTGDADSFAKFREVMRYLNQEVNVFAKILEKWDTIGPNKEHYRHIARQLNDGGDSSGDDRHGAAGEVDRAMVDRAIDEAIAKLKRVRIVILGEFDTGKTNFLRALLGLKFVTDGNSTETVKISRTLFRVPLSAIRENVFMNQPILSAMRQGESLLSNETARAMLGNQAELQQMITSTTVTEQVADAEYTTGRTQADRYIPAESAQSLAAAAAERSEWKHLRDIPKKVLEAISSVDESTLQNSVYVEAWDLGGQMSMAAHQTVCLDSSRTLFVLVTDASKDLDGRVPDDIFRYRGEPLKSPAMFPEMTHRSFIQTWLSTIAMHQGTATPQQQRITVLVIATHIDVVEERATGDEEVKQAKKAYRIAIDGLINSESNQLDVQGPYFVDNRPVNEPVSKHSEMKEVQKQLFEAFKRVDETEVPLLQLKLENAIGILNNTDRSQEHSAQSGQSAPCLEYAEFVELAEVVCKKAVPEEVVQEWLATLHQNAVVYWSNHSNPEGNSLVFLSIEWLLSQFMDIISCPMKMEHSDVEFRGLLEKHVRHLSSTGFVRPLLLEKLWVRHLPAVRDALVSAMVRLNFACAPKTDEASMYIPLSVEEPNFKIPDSVKQALPPLKLCFLDMYFPPPLFTRLCMLLATSKLIVTKSMKFRYGSMLFTLCGGLGTIRLTWTPSGLVIELFRKANAKRPTAPVAVQVRSLINKYLAEMQSKGYKRLSGTPHILCEAGCEPDISSVDGKWWDSTLCLPWVVADETDRWCKKCQAVVECDSAMQWFSDMQDGASAMRDASPASAENASVQTAAQQDTGGIRDLFDSLAYGLVRLDLIDHMDFSVRVAAEAFSLITSEQMDRLRTTLKDRSEHNRELFRMMEAGGLSAIKTFSDRVLVRLGRNFETRKARLDDILAKAAK